MRFFLKTFFQLKKREQAIGISFNFLQKNAYYVNFIILKN
jgi:hypothetical protein